MVVKQNKGVTDIRSWCFDCRAQRSCGFRGPRVDFCSHFKLIPRELVDQYKQLKLFER